MKVMQSQVTLKSRRHYQQTRSQTLDVKIGGQQTGERPIDSSQIDSNQIFTPTRFTHDLSLSSQQKSLSLQSWLRRLSQKQPLDLNDSISTQQRDSNQITPSSIQNLEELPSITGDKDQDAKLYAFALLISKMTGKPVYLTTLDQDTLKKCQVCTPNEAQAQPPSSQSSEEPIIDIHYQEERHEQEFLQVEGRGSVQLEDGRQIDFDMNVSFERYLSQKVELNLTNRPLKDPLIIDFGPQMAQFTDQKFEFDLDADGTMDWMPMLDSHGGVLIMDHDEDGEVDDGSEVIGALSNDAFGDLRMLDDDQNGWIDEQDQAYQNLKVWTWDEEGNQQLMALMQANVGAIYLGAVEADFSQLDDAHQVIAQQRAMSVYLKNSGDVGSVRKVDVAL